MRRVALLLALLTLSSVLAPAAVGTADARPAAPSSPAEPAVTTPGDPPRQQRLAAPANTTIELRVYGNRSARWTVAVTYELESANETAAFREYAEAYRTGETDRGPTADLFRRIVGSASEAAGRRMTLRDVERSASVDNATGTIRLSFVWTAMLERTGNRTIRLDDAVLFPGNRTWLGTLEPNQTLVVRTPDGYSIVDSEAPSFDLRNNSVVIAGPARIQGNLDITYRRTVRPDTGLPDGLSVAGIVLVVAAVVAVAVYVRRREGGPPTAPVGEAGSPPTDGDGGSAGGAPGVEESVAGAAGAGSEPEADDEGAGADAVDPELLSDEERVEHLLRENGGRMKQASIVDETGWSDAKVSQLLSSMADEGRVNKLRLGRENLISLPEEDGDDVGNVD